MSIVVTCACEMTYRLPDRYAGKRCRCRECGGAIKVPREGAEAAAKGRKSKASEGKPKRDKSAAKRTTRRMASQERQDIRSEQLALRGAGKMRPVSESMHQLSPLDMSRVLESPEALAPRKRPAPRKPAREKSNTSAPEGKTSKARRNKGRAGSRSESGEQAEAPTKRRKKGLKPDERTKGKEGKTKGKRGKAEQSQADAPAKAKPKKAKDRQGKAAPEPETGKDGKKKRGEKTASKAVAAKTTGKAKRPGTRSGTRSGARDREDEEREGKPQGKRRRDPVRAALIIAAVLCLAVGLTLGVALSGGASGGGSSELAAKLTSAMETVQQLKAKREWEAARGALSPLVDELDKAGMAAEASKVRSEMRTLDALTQLSSIEDDEARLATLLDYARNPDAAVRLGVTHELRSLSGQPEAQDALAGLARDSDPKVAENARQGLIAAGGPQSIPYLAQAITDAAATGGKQGEIALQRALELDEPAVVPVLIKALEVRPDAPAATVKAILSRLRELGEPSAKEAVKKLTAHADPGVKKLAEETLADLGG